MSAHDEAVAAALAAVKNDGPFGCKDVVGSCVTPHRCTCVRDTETAITAYLSHLRAAGSGYTAGAEAMREAAIKAQENLALEVSALRCDLTDQMVTENTLRAEVERLQMLVRSGYTEGWQDARAAEGDPDETSSDAWDMSAARAALAPKP